MRLGTYTVSELKVCFMSHELHVAARKLMVHVFSLGDCFIPRLHSKCKDFPKLNVSLVSFPDSIP